jgi:hypothetical protein
MPLSGGRIYARDSRPFGLSLSDWSTKWWQWLLSMPKEINPTNDATGENASIGQFDPNVFFLCQTVESVKKYPSRKVSIPKGRSIFMPVLNWISNFYKHGRSDQELIDTARARMDAIGRMEVLLDGENIQGLEQYRLLTGFFFVDLPKDNILDLPPGVTRLTSDGYWLFTQPVLKNTTISTFGSCSSGITKIGVSYSIEVI